MSLTRLAGAIGRRADERLGKALEVAQRGYVIETGKVSMQGSSAELLQNPAVRSAYLGL